MCIVDDEGSAPSLSSIRVREDLFEEMPPLIDISINDKEIECIPPPLVDLMVVEDNDSEVVIIEPDIIYLKTFVNIDISSE